jgi:DNA-binding response OmpR family regulator
MKNILFIDDNVQSGILAKIYLEKEGYHVFVAKDTTKARSYLSNHDMHCIITDIGMPGENGIDFYKWIRAQDAYKNIPVFMISAHAFSLGDLDIDLDNFFMEKPIFYPSLINRLKKILKED